MYVVHDEMRQIGIRIIRLEIGNPREKFYTRKYNSGLDDVKAYQIVKWNCE